MKQINSKSFLYLTIGFILTVIIGTVSHEFGHAIVAEALGYDARISYGSMGYTNPITHGLKPETDKLLVTIGGPALTLISGTLALCFVIYYSGKERWRRSIYYWILVFISLFWLRQVVNASAFLFDYLVLDKISPRGDEIKIARFFNLPPGSVLMVTAFIGLIIGIIVTFRFISRKHRPAFIASGIIGGISGYILWLEILGPVIMP